MARERRQKQGVCTSRVLGTALRQGEVGMSWGSWVGAQGQDRPGQAVPSQEPCCKQDTARSSPGSARHG